MQNLYTRIYITANLFYIQGAIGSFLVSHETVSKPSQDWVTAENRSGYTHSCIGVLDAPLTYTVQSMYWAQLFDKGRILLGLA